LYIVLAPTLLPPEADPNIVDDWGFTALHVASLEGKLFVVEYLLSHAGTDASIISNYGSTLLHLASLEGRLGVVQCLLCNGFQQYINIPDDGGFTALFGASQGGHFKVVACLIQFGADANIANDEGATPLHGTCVKGDVDVAHLLVQVRPVENNLRECIDQSIYASIYLYINISMYICIYVSTNLSMCLSYLLPQPITTLAGSICQYRRQERPIPSVHCKPAGQLKCHAIPC
jgi:ankyrin repeat protein